MSSAPSGEESAAWTRVTALFDELVEATADARESALAERSAGDPLVVQQVRLLLAAHDSSDGRFDVPALSRISVKHREALLPPDPLLSAPRLGTYLVLRKIGEGGMGAVYEAERADDAFHKRVAIKTIARGAESSVIVSRFRRERQILAELQHPNIAALLDGGMTDTGTPYFVMEYVDGQTIDAYCASKKLSVVQRLDLMQQVCRAVQHAHKHLVVHRDLKPHNVLVSEDGVVKLLDFGVARLTDSASDDGGAIAPSMITRDSGSPLTVAYASPEQLRGDAVSTASDVYSLGVMLYELLAGVLPFARDGRNFAQFRDVVLQTEPPLPSSACTEFAAEERRAGSRSRLSRHLSGELDAIVLMAMRKDSARRYSSVEALGLDLQRFLRGQPVSARPDNVSYRAKKFIDRHRWPVAMVSSLLVIAVIAGVTIARQSAAAQRESARSARIANFLQGVLGAADAASLSGAMPRVGPGASLGVLLDSAVGRVPKEFANDAAIRARLYLTIGSSFVAQGRMREASRVLDSAITTAAQAYGEESETFVLANLEASAASLHRNNSVRADSLLRRALQALTRAGRTESELFARALKDRASLALVSGDYAQMASDARAALAIEERRTTSPTLVRAVALNRLASSFVAEGAYPRADSIYRRSIAGLRSIGATQNLEMLDVLSNAQSVARALGHSARADSLVDEGLAMAQKVFGPDSREMAIMLTAQADGELRRGDTASARRSTNRAAHIIDSIPEVLSVVRMLVLAGGAQIDLVRRDWAAAQRSLARAVAELPQDKGLFAIQLNLLRGAVFTNLGALDSADVALARATTAYNATGLHWGAMRHTIHIEQARIYNLRSDTLGVRRELADFLPAEMASARAALARDRLPSK
jgi:serine/threonine-protein kinase